jgi:predicted metal-dependent hydrolase
VYSLTAVMNKIEGILLSIIVVISVFYIQKVYLEVSYVISTVDGEKYLVRNSEGKQTAANILARLNSKIEKLIKHLLEKYPQDARVIRLSKNYKRENISEGTESSNYTSYSVNKGEKIIFCVRERDKSGDFVSENVLMYVATHELGHLMTEEVGHTDTFWSNFKMLLEEAININVYTHVDYSKSPTTYCGINIKSSII